MGGKIRAQQGGGSTIILAKRIQKNTPKTIGGKVKKKNRFRGNKGQEKAAKLGQVRMTHRSQSLLWGREEKSTEHKWREKKKKERKEVINEEMRRYSKQTLKK